jgi:hypothetical protein
MWFVVSYSAAIAAVLRETMIRHYIPVPDQHERVDQPVITRLDVGDKRIDRGVIDALCLRR